MAPKNVDRFFLFRHVLRHSTCSGMFEEFSLPRVRFDFRVHVCAKQRCKHHACAVNSESFSAGLVCDQRCRQLVFPSPIYSLKAIGGVHLPTSPTRHLVQPLALARPTLLHHYPSPPPLLSFFFFVCCRASNPPQSWETNGQRTCIQRRYSKSFRRTTTSLASCRAF